MDIAAWTNFFLAEVGASAALTGLLFVGVSINLARILSISKLPNRALEALLLLVTALTESSLVLVPQRPAWLGAEVLIIGALVWASMIYLDRGQWGNVHPGHVRRTLALIAANQLSLAAYTIAGLLILESVTAGLGLLVFAILLSFVKSIADAWVLLVEINR